MADTVRTAPEGSEGAGKMRGKMSKSKNYRVFLLATGLLGGVLLAFVSAAKAQSFNCNYARTPDEVLICQEGELARLDERLASIYARVRGRLDAQDRRELEFEQSSWLQSRKECGRDFRCIESHYRRRIDQLLGN